VLSGVSKALHWLLQNMIMYSVHRHINIWIQRTFVVNGHPLISPLNQGSLYYVKSQNFEVSHYLTFSTLNFIPSVPMLRVGIVSYSAWPRT
jgi:hypothetical protein